MPLIFYCCRSRLPQEQKWVKFFVDEREAPVVGRFAGGRFHSRWAVYDVSRVQSWQETVAGADSMHGQAADWTIRQRLGRNSVLGRLSNFLRSRAADRDAAPTSHARANASVELADSSERAR